MFVTPFRAGSPTLDLCDLRLTDGKLHRDVLRIDQVTSSEKSGAGYPVPVQPLRNALGQAYDRDRLGVDARSVQNH
jgi:hypothetical protein